MGRKLIKMSLNFTFLCFILFAILAEICQCWLPDTNTKLFNSYNKISSISFKGNRSFTDYFTVLYKDDDSILLGGRNRVYNLSLFDFKERQDSAIFWPSLEAHGQLCLLKGKTEDDCQNYMRIFFYVAPGKFYICGTNSYKPLCRIIQKKDDKLVIEKEMEGIGLCPFDPEHNSTAIYSGGHLFSATVADFSGTDHLIYKEPLRTELSDLTQLNAPNFVSTLTHGDYIYFFFRETAVEYMNCGKVIYSRVARVCSHDKGGPHQSKDRWTTFTKARLNCSVPGEYPFYFDEIQSLSSMVEGKYSDESRTKVVYASMTTPNNAIGGSAICVFQMSDIENVFDGPFKHQESLNSNWLPVLDNQVPKPRPGACVQDSRVLADKSVNFIKTHPLMERTVPAFHGRPLLIRVSLHYRFTSVAVDPQVRTVTDETYDVIYIGTDDGKVIKVVNIPTADSFKAFVISENEVFSKHSPVKQIKTATSYGKIVAVSKEEAKLVTLNHCSTITHCSNCIELRDPHCAWDSIKTACVSVDIVTSYRYLIQDVKKGDISKCNAQPSDKKSDEKNEQYDDNIIETDYELSHNRRSPDAIVTNDLSGDCNEIGCTAPSKVAVCSSQYLPLLVTVASLVALFFGFVCGYLVSKKFQVRTQYPNAPYIEQHNHFDRLNGNQNSFLAPRNKTVNLDVLNVSTDSLPPKKDNLGSLKNLNITNEGTLQKIKKTYI